MAKAKKKSKPKNKNPKSKNPRKPARPAVRKPVRQTAQRAGSRRSWLDDTAESPQIDSYARKLSSFVDALADGVVQESELHAQEKRLVKLMKEVEPRLDDELHERVTELLCELTAYDIMQLLHSMHAARPQSAFQG